MHSLKDYYSILELSPASTVDDVKKAYRRLALQFHPDKNPGDAYAAAQFAEIKEAYETLTSPGRKEQYLQQRWYAQSTGQRVSQPIVTPVNLLKLMLELDRHVRTLDVHRLDQEGFRYYLLSLLETEHIRKIKSFNEADINKEIISAAPGLEIRDRRRNRGRRHPWRALPGAAAVDAPASGAG